MSYVNKTKVSIFVIFNHRTSYMDLPQFLTVSLVILFAIMSPGPDFVIVTRNSLVYSKSTGLYTVFGITLGVLIWVALSIIGVSFLLAKAAIVFTIIKYVGALYLFYIGWKSLRAKPMDFEKGMQKDKEMSFRSAFMTGFLTNLFNAKAALFFVSFFSVVISPEVSMSMRSVYGAMIVFTTLSWFSLVATVLSIGWIKNFFRKISVWIERFTGALLVALGAKLAVTD
jgi:RhtB (resistance to homoserine/threonine) family protein